MTDENIILKRISLDDVASFEQLFVHYQPILVQFITAFIKDEEQARDMSQDIFIKIWSQRRELYKVKCFSAWLYKNARFAIYHYFSHNLVSRKYISEAMHMPGMTDDVEEQCFAGELETMIDLAISHMPAQRRKIFEMSRKKGLTNQQIANLLGISKRTVENQITASLAELRKIV